MKKVLYSLFALSLIFSSCTESVNKDLEAKVQPKKGKISFVFSNSQSGGQGTSASSDDASTSTVIVSDFNIIATNADLGTIEKTFSFNESSEFDLPYGNYEIEVTTESTAEALNKVYTNSIPKMESIEAYTEILSEIQPVYAGFSDADIAIIMGNSYPFIGRFMTESARINIILETTDKYDFDMHVDFYNRTYDVFKATGARASAIVFNEKSIIFPLDIEITLTKYRHGTTFKIGTYHVKQADGSYFRSEPGKEKTILIKYTLDNKLTYTSGGFTFSWSPMGESGEVVYID
jgi:hypothetical protein